MLSIADVTATVPVLTDSFVPRPRLLETLGSGHENGVVLVCAPAGFGKTTLLAHWARTAEPGTGIAWADIERGDNDPGRLWTTILTAVTACPVVPPDSSLHRLGRTALVSWAEPGFVSEVVAALDALPARVALVLHDVHELDSSVALKALQSLVAARPAGVRLLLCSRRDPPLSLVELRSAGRLREVRVDQLRLSLNETSAVLRRAGLHLTRAQVGDVHAGTGGWPAGVRLTSAALRGAADPHEFLERLATDTRPVADFLVGEVLACLSGADRQVLSAISIGDSVPTALSGALSVRPDAGAVLDRIARDTGLVSRGHAPAASFRVHPLAAAYLRAEHPDRASSTDLPARAVFSWLAEGDAIAAASHALQAAGDAPLIELTRRYAGVLLVSGHHDVLRRVLCTLGKRVVAGDPWLTLCSTRTHIQAGDLAGAEADLVRARALLPADPHPRLAVLHSLADTVRSILPHTLVEALLVEATCGLTGREVHPVRHAPRAARPPRETLGVVRLFTMAEAQARETLGTHLARSGTNEPFAARALTDRPRPDRRPAHLDERELRVLTQLSSPLSVEGIATRLRVSTDEAQARMRTVYRKLGVSSRRAAVTAAFERGLLR
jgi:LuxR family transcriptional regulator, maltose regulon positive regulatory protein